MDGAKQKVVELKQLVGRIDKVYDDAQKILVDVKIFDKAAHSNAESSVNTIQKIRIQIYIAAAKSLATLVTNMAKSAEAAAAAAITAGEEVNAADISGEDKGVTSATSATITRDKFDELTKTFDAAVAAYDSITTEGEDLDFQRYLTMADTMLINFKGKKDELTMALKGAEEAVRLFKIQEKSAVKKDETENNTNILK